ncbi:MBL fold metallo-hydrolase [Fidelibacter multiformis]|uniref:MBL fold metallo-hydrolase n=1 Tax=Fidelibacter multiformis TaxID=3377529 RepID=UPI0037DC2F76
MTMELNILGTASQLPTAKRNHGGCLLHWQGENILLDPGEGIQRQCVKGGLSVPAIRTICISHFHGDHCLGLPGIIQRISLAKVTEPVTIIYPGEGEDFLKRLLTCSDFHQTLTLKLLPIPCEGIVFNTGKLRIEAVRLKHRIQTFGFRIVQPGGYRFDKEKLAVAGIKGKSVGILQEKGELQTERGVISRESVSKPVPDRVFAYVADTAPGNHVNHLMDHADLLLCETTFMESERNLAEAYDHLTTGTAAKAALENKVGFLIATHFSERYRDNRVIEKELREIFPRCYTAEDLTRFSLVLKTKTLHVETIRKKNGQAT